MAFKLVALFALVTIANAVQIAYQPTYQSAYQQSSPLLVKQLAAPVYTKQIQYEAPAEYDFNYSVHDEHTGDIKSQQESRKGDNVQGQYTLIDADGYRRVVDYTADEHNGFNAVVRREPLQGAYKQVVPVQKVLAAPIQVAKYVSASPYNYHY